MHDVLDDLHGRYHIKRSWRVRKVFLKVKCVDLPLASYAVLISNTVGAASVLVPV